MSIQLQLRRGNTTENQSFTGAEGEVTVDTQTHELTVHDGSTVGGHTIPTKSWVTQKIERMPAVYFTPTVDVNGNISWTNNGGLENPTARNIKGPQGIPGPQGGSGDTGHTTNCITQIPQNIKLEFNNDELTLKKDSKTCIPNGNTYIPDTDTWNTTDNNIYGPVEWTAMCSTTINNQQRLMAIDKTGCIGWSDLTTITVGSVIKMLGRIYYNQGLTSLHDSINKPVAFAISPQKHVVIYQQGYVSTSMSGTGSDWTAPAKAPGLNPTSVGGLSWSSLVYDGEKFVALDTHGYISTSTDGENWTTATKNTDLYAYNNWGSLIYDGEKYIAIGGGYTHLNEGIMYIATSSDLVNWTIIQKEYDNVTTTTDRWIGITHNENKYITISRFGYISTSTDGENWTTPSRILSEAGIINILYIQEKFLVLTQDGKIFVSEDTTNWTNWYCNDMYCYLNNISVAYDGTKYIGLRRNGTLFTSTDGINWTEQLVGENYLAAKANVQNQTCMWDSLIYDGTQFITFASANNSCMIATSIDGINWPLDQIHNNEDLRNSHIHNVIFDGTKYKAIDTTGWMWTSTNLIDWYGSQEAHLVFDAHSSRTFFYANGKYIILSENGYVSTSTDGENWTEGTQNTNLTSYGWSTGIVYDGEKFVALSRRGYISTSTDGENWTPAIANTDLGNNQWKTILYDSEKLITLSADSYSAVTTNSEAIPGYTFTTITEDTKYSFNTETGKYMLFSDGSYFTLSNCVSGDSDPLANQPYHAWYDLSTNSIKIYGEDGSIPIKITGFPISVITLNSGYITNIEQIFNGFGYIGSVVFLLSGVKGFIPNGRNANGDLNNIEFLSLSDAIRIEISDNADNLYITTDGSRIYCNSSIEYNYILNKNIIDNSIEYKTAFAKINVESGAITSFKAKQVFLIKDTNDDILFIQN